MNLKVSDHFKFDEILKLYRNPEDLKLAYPSADYPVNSSEWNEWINCEKANCFSLLFYQDEELVSHLAIKDYHANPGLCYLCFFIIDPNHRSKGYSKEILNQTYEFVKEQLQKKDLWLVVSEENPIAHGLYTKEGFLQIDTRPGGIRMKKRL
ncbi:hypothetical protein A9Q84_07390 [Halobacteriovorax marinus]|uniref:N-acetyltransferase domain-containing protein n=1 Tax=Halobacteriovorax marinus TaxID=97084 RepID=A0A1Y5F5K4_9BACT|nr:hypothetical protein A9Q84_07390 [Halobacteriovorax marinus]